MGLGPWVDQRQYLRDDVAPPDADMSVADHPHRVEVHRAAVGQGVHGRDALGE